MRVTHPFHPLAGQEFDLVVRKNNWAEDRVFFFVEDSQICSVPAGWTDVDPGDPFVVVAAGRSVFRVDDLVSLASLIEGLWRDAGRAPVKPTLPSV